MTTKYAQVDELNVNILFELQENSLGSQPAMKEGTREINKVNEQGDEGGGAFQ